MARQLGFAATLLVVWSVSAAPVLKDRKPSPEQLAMAAARGAWRASESGPEEDLLPFVDVPFLDDGHVWNDRNVVKQRILNGHLPLKHEYMEPQDGPDAVMTVPKFLAFVRENRRERLTVAEEADIRKVTGNDGLVVLQTRTAAYVKKGKTPAFFIRIQDGVAKVVGSLD